MKTLEVVVLLLLLLSPRQCLLMSGGDLFPLVLVPGLSGNQLEARLTEAYQPSLPSCGAQKGNGWFRAWFNYSMLLDSQTQQCLAEQMKLFYDQDADDFRNVAGVETRVPFFGSTEGFRYTDPDHKNMSSYMASLVEYLEEIGYKDGDNLFGAPYDFRYGLAANGHNSRVGSQYLQDLKELVENASKLNGDKPVIILTHSLGGLLTLQLLHRNPTSWSQKFIKHFIALSSPWGGTVLEMLLFGSGSSLGLPFVNPLVTRPLMRSYESNLWLQPSPKVFGEAPLVVTKSKNYSASNISDFFNDIGFNEGVKPYETRILPFVQELAVPQVPVTCMTGVGVETAETLFYGDGGFDEFPEGIVFGDGDGSVNLVSLLALDSQWSNLPEQNLKLIKIPNVSHNGIIKEDLPLRKIIRQVLDLNNDGWSSSY